MAQISLSVSKAVQFCPIKISITVKMRELWLNNACMVMTFQQIKLITNYEAASKPVI